MQPAFRMLFMTNFFFASVIIVNSNLVSDFRFSIEGKSGIGNTMAIGKTNTPRFKKPNKVVQIRLYRTHEVTERNMCSNKEQG